MSEESIKFLDGRLYVFGLIVKIDVASTLNEIQFLGLLGPFDCLLTKVKSIGVAAGNEQNRTRGDQMDIIKSGELNEFVQASKDVFVCRVAVLGARS